MRKYKQGLFTPLFPKKYAGNTGNIIYRSSWEWKLFKYLDENVNVISWVSEEVVIPYVNPFDGKYHRYFPDVLAKIRLPDGSIKTMLFEVKPASQVIEPIKKTRVSRKYVNEVVTYGINQAKFEAARKYCGERNWEFKILTENELGI